MRNELYESGKKGQCPHCGKQVRFNEAYIHDPSSVGTGLRRFDGVTLAYDKDDIDWVNIAASTCSLCNNLVVWMDHPKEALLWPLSPNRPVPKEVPDTIALVYKRAVSHLGKDDTACAVFARTCLEKLLDDLGVPRCDNLGERVKKFTESIPLSSEVKASVDPIREMGNFVHLNENLTTGELVDVEYDDALYVLDLLDSLFDEVYVKPARNKLMQDKVQKKLESVRRKTKQ